MNIGFIGCGRMGGALLEGVIGAKIVNASNVWVFDAFREASEAISKKLGVHIASDNADLVAKSDFILLACKPYQVIEILEEIKNALTNQKVILSIAAGVTIRRMQEALPDRSKIIRVMPNTPSLIGYGASGIAAGKNATNEDLRTAQAILESVGIVEITNEDQIDAVTALSGSGPAYVYTFIESLIKQAQEEGLSNQVATNLATQTLIGAAKMVETTNISPAKLRDQVTSPGGTTLAGLKSLSDHGFENAIIEGVKAAAKRSREIAEES